MISPAINPLLRLSWDAVTLMEQHPLRFTHASKEHAFGLVLPPGTVHAGTLEVTRWAAMPLPAVIPAGDGLRVEVQPNAYDYAPVTSPTPVREWHVNFADGKPLLRLWQLALCAGRDAGAGASGAGGGA
ncbi:MAG: hypothetical protein V9E87_17680 [Gemmatimonadales bacterium]